MARTNALRRTRLASTLICCLTAESGCLRNTNTYQRLNRRRHRAFALREATTKLATFMTSAFSLLLQRKLSPFQATVLGTAHASAPIGLAGANSLVARTLTAVQRLGEDRGRVCLAVRVTTRSSRVSPIPSYFFGL